MGILQNTAHRPWPLPSGRWLMTQTWHNLLFAHWPVENAILHPLIPAGLELDTFEGQAWLGIVPFRLSHVRLNGLPRVPLVSYFSEINVRTYVLHDGIPGVFFLSMDTDNRFTTALARPWFHLPYYNARVRMRVSASVYFSSQRTARYASPATFCGCYNPSSAVYHSEPGSLESWLTERYCYFSPGSRGRLYRCDIHHDPWPLQKACLHTLSNTMALSQGISLPEPDPLLHYCRKLKAYIWPVRRATQEVSRRESNLATYNLSL